MGIVTATASKPIKASPEEVLAFLRDYRDCRPRILTEHFSDYRVEQGGQGAGTVIGYRFTAGGRTRDYQLEAQESDGVLEERDHGSSFVSRWTVAPSADGSLVTLAGSWTGAGGIGGVFEGLFAPMSLRRIYGEVLDRLAAAVQAAPG